MTLFERLRVEFGVNWTTLLVGWDRPGRFSHAVISVDEIDAYATERLVSSPTTDEEELVVRLLALNLRCERPEVIRERLVDLSTCNGADPSVELRKWRIALLEECLDNIPAHPIYGLTALTDFWNQFEYPPDSPHVVQGRGNSITPTEYYCEENLQRLLARHRAWIQVEKHALQMLGPEKGPEKV
jgi:hypothetical protein